MTDAANEIVSKSFRMKIDRMHSGSIHQGDINKNNFKHAEEHKLLQDISEINKNEFIHTAFIINKHTKRELNYMF